MAPESRAEYMKERRSKYKAFHVEVDKDRMECFEGCLKKQNRTKKEWLESKIDEELGK